MASGDKFYIGTGGEVSIKGESKYFSIDETVTTTVVNKALGFTSRRVKYISNDGSTDLYISFGATNVTTNGLNGRIRLASGETLQELNIAVESINLAFASGSGVVRAVIV